MPVPTEKEKEGERETRASDDEIQYSRTGRFHPSQFRPRIIVAVKLKPFYLLPVLLLKPRIILLPFSLFLVRKAFLVQKP